MSEATKAVAVHLTPAQKRAVGHYAVEHDLTQKDALLRLIMLGLEGHLKDCVPCAAAK